MGQESLQPLGRIRRMVDVLMAEEEAAATGAGAGAGSAVAPWWHRFARYWIHVGRGFGENRCSMRAAGLAYTTLLALVPLLAVVMGIAAGMLKKEGERPVQAMIDLVVAKIAPQLNLQVNLESAEGVARREQVVRSIEGYISNIQSGALGTFGTIGLIGVALLLLTSIESALNDIWEVKTGRRWTSRVVNYWAAITLGPLILILVLGLTSTPEVQGVQVWIDRQGFWFRGLCYIAFSWLPFIVMSLALSMFYMLMPNAYVPFRAALVGGVLAGCLIQLNSLFSIVYISKVLTYDKIYGSFGMVPIFLVGMYFSWLILLFGAQVACTYQRRCMKPRVPAAAPA